MRPLRYTINLGDGVKAEMLFTPHLYSFKGTAGVTFEADARSLREVYEVYADIMFCAALNAWVLDGNGSVEDFPHKRGDFHAFMTAYPKDFGKALDFALKALTGKSLHDFIQSASEASQSAKESKTEDNQPEESKKKLRSRLIGWLSKRS